MHRQEREDGDKKEHVTFRATETDDIARVRNPLSFVPPVVYRPPSSPDR